MPGTLEDPQLRLNALYALRASLITALTNPSSDVQSYQIGDRNVTVRSLTDLEPLNKMISVYESILTSDVTIKADMGGLSNMPSPFAVSGFGQCDN